MMEEAEGEIEDELEVSAAAMELYLASIPSSTRITIVKKGVLMKKGTGLVYRPWSRRMIIVDSQNRLSYFDGEILKGSFFLTGTLIETIGPALANGRLHAFQISNIDWKKTSRNRLILAASSATEAEEWMSCLRLVAQYPANIPPSTPPAVTTRKISQSTSYVSLKDLKATSRPSPLISFSARELKDQRWRDSKLLQTLPQDRLHDSVDYEEESEEDKDAEEECEGLHDP